MILHTRNAATDALVRLIDDDDIVALDLWAEKVRLVTPRHRRPTSERVCIVCGCQLVGTQVDVCSGHWDYVSVEGIDPDQRYADFLTALAEWLREHLTGLRVESTQMNFPAVLHCKCEVCGRPTGLVEVMRNSKKEVVKRHHVCHDHRSFRDGGRPVRSSTSRR